MRDPERIPRICRELQELWAKHPDLRLGQLIWNAMHDSIGQGALANDYDGTGCMDFFYMEDEEFIKAIENHLTKFTQSSNISEEKEINP